VIFTRANANKSVYDNTIFHDVHRVQFVRSVFTPFKTMAMAIDSLCFASLQTNSGPDHRKVNGKVVPVFN